MYPWSGHTLPVDGGNLNYVDEGPRDAPVMLCVHGNPTWSFYWRKLVETYSDRFRVVVPDHIGCGLSDKPQDWDYRLGGHIGNLTRLIEHLDLTDITLVVHDWGGAIGSGAATRLPDRFSRIVVTNTAAFRSQSIPPSIASCRIPLFGDVAVRGFNGFAWAATWRTTVRPLDKAVKEGLLHPYDSWANRIATLRFVEDIPMKADHPSWDTLIGVEDGLEKLADKPMMVLWGEQDWCFTPEFRREWQRRFPSAQVHAWDDVGHYVMEDAPERVVEAIDAFIA
ncbi:MAG: alpha/beta fold hydrolase [Proteobacteria bacterium]|nr:alpha/beta fold hydrolase [Pseudomonadota bacterium]MCP4921128.1 alpha/beta fold hydrolase [Pseudomonadota bacterium]